MDKHHAVIESATPLNDGTSASIVQNLQQKYGQDLTTEFKVNPELSGGWRIGGMRIVKIGSDVKDEGRQHCEPAARFQTILTKRQKAEGRR